MSARGVWCQITLPEGRTPRGKGYLTQTRGLTPSRGSNSVITQILYLITHLALYLLVFSHVCWCIPRPFVCAGHQNPFIGQGQGYSICKFTYLESYWWSLDKGVLMQMSFYARLLSPALLTTKRLIYADVINRSRDHSFFIRSLQNPTLKMSRIAQHVGLNTTQTAIMSAWHYCFIPPICSSRLYILITISKHDAWSPKVFLFDENECHPAPCIPSSRNF